MGAKISNARASITALAGRDAARAACTGSSAEAPRRQVRLEIDSLLLDGSPRLDGENPTHTRTLAEADTGLPPILVHRETMRVIDGVHRVQAARLKGERAIDAIFFDGDVEAAFVEAVEANIRHGLPLSLADRRAAAVRIIAIKPQWSDRAVAASAGLSPKTVRAIRDRAIDGSAEADMRVGRDGRVRPRNIADGRRRAAHVIASQPHASLREIATTAGVSVGTARDVRTRIRNGDDPVPDRGRPGRANGSGGHGRMPSGRDVEQEARAAPASGRTPPAIVKILGSDPSLRYSETGRGIVRWLDSHSVDAVALLQIADALPVHCAYLVRELAVGCAQAWQEFADDLIEQANAAERQGDGNV